MKYDKTQPGNPHRLTVHQHIIPCRSIERFHSTAGSVDIYIDAAKRVEKVRAQNPIFTARRVWDQRAESWTMKSVEDEFQRLATKMVGGYRIALALEHHVISRFYALLRIRNQFAEQPFADVPLNGILPERELSLDDQEKLEKRHLLFMRPDGTMPGRFIAGVRYQIELDRWMEQLETVRWGRIQANSGEFMVPDNFGEYLMVPLTPTSYLVGNSEDHIIETESVVHINQIALSLRRRFIFARDFQACPVISGKAVLAHHCAVHRL